MPHNRIGREALLNKNVSQGDLPPVSGGNEFKTAEGSDDFSGLRFDEAGHFLSLVNKAFDKAYLRAIDPLKSRTPGGDAGFSEGWIQEKVNAGFNVYMVIGETSSPPAKGGGIKDADIESCGAFFVEWDDGASLKEQASRWKALGLPEPTVMVATGGKSLHVYWTLEEPLAPTRWKELQTRLITHCNGDKTCKNPSRVMRLPGCPYFNKQTGKITGQCRIYAASGLITTADGIEACLPPVPVAPAVDLFSAVDQPSTTHTPRPIEEIRDAARHIPRRAGGQGTYERDRNALCGCAAALRAAGAASPDDEALSLLGSCWPTPQAARQVLASTTTRNAASFWAVAKENGFNLSRSQSPAVEASSKPATANSSGAIKPITFDDRWEALEGRAAELICEPWSVMKILSALGSTASDLDFRLGRRDLEALLDQAQLQLRGKSDPVQGGKTFEILPTLWAVEGIFRHGLNLLTGQSGAGKSRLAAACMAAWLRGDETWLQKHLYGCDVAKRRALIVGTDQSLMDWHVTLNPVGLTRKVRETEVKLHERLTLFGLESGVKLDADGLAKIRRWCDENPGGMVLVDSLSACLPPGIDEDKSGAARPVHGLQEALGDAWALLTHHSRKAAGKDQNLGVGAGRGSGAIDAAVSRVVGLGLTYRMINGTMVPQEADPRRELLSTKRGGKTEHLIIASDSNGFWEVRGNAAELKRQELHESALANLTAHQSDVLSAFQTSASWITTRQISEAMGDAYDAKGAKSAQLRKTLQRLQVIGFIESMRVGVEKCFRVVCSDQQEEANAGKNKQARKHEFDMTYSVCSETAPQGVSPARTSCSDLLGPETDRSAALSQSPAKSSGQTRSDHGTNNSEQVSQERASTSNMSEQLKTVAPQSPSNPSDSPLSGVHGPPKTRRRKKRNTQASKPEVGPNGGLIVVELYPTPPAQLPFVMEDGDELT
jgi:Fe2+ or Zn2+ uptake regulation protein